MYSIQNTLLSTEKNMSQLEENSKFVAPEEAKNGSVYEEIKVQKAENLKNLDLEKHKIEFKKALSYFNILTHLKKWATVKSDFWFLFSESVHTISPSAVKTCETIMRSNDSALDKYRALQYKAWLIGQINNSLGDYLEKIKVLEDKNLEATQDGYTGECMKTAFNTLENIKSKTGNDLFINKHLRLAILDFAF